MKTTLELPDDLMRALKVRAARSDRKLKDLVAELIERGLETSLKTNTVDPMQAWERKLVVNADGSFTNPDGIDDSEFFEALDRVRDYARRELPRDPFAPAD